MPREPIVNDSLVEFAVSLAASGRDIALRHFRSGLDAAAKADGSPVTVADRAIEALLREKIRERYPEHGILGEEEEGVRLDSESVWVVDPIDGTKSFITGMPLFGTLVALLTKDVPMLGVLDFPVSGESFVGVAGRSSTLNGRDIRCSGCESLAAARLYTTSPDNFSPDDWRRYELVSARARYRRYGGDAYLYALLAMGEVDVVAEAGLQPYDYMALVAVVRGAGGVITDWQGQPLSRRSDGRVLAASSPSLHSEALALLQS